MQDLESVDEVVDLSHETFHEDDPGEAHTQGAEFGGERLLRKINL